MLSVDSKTLLCRTTGGPGCGNRRLCCTSLAESLVTTEQAYPAKIQMSSFQFEIQLGVINAGGAGGGTGTVTDLKTIPVVVGGSKAVFERNIML